VINLSLLLVPWFSDQVVLSDPVLGQDCVSSELCRVRTKHTECASGKCQCMANFKSNGNGTCIPGKLMNVLIGDFLTFNWHTFSRDFTVFLSAHFFFSFSWFLSFSSCLLV
jgi:hypothetical protein